MVTFAYNPAGQIIGRDATNNSYAAAGFANQNVADTHDGLNRVTASGGATITHDARGNLTSDGTRTYGYSSENRLTSVGGVGAYSYDPLGRLAATPAGYFAVHDGDRMTEEYNTGGGRSAVYVPGPAMDEALASIGYLGDRYYLIADERGSVLNAVNESGVQWGTFKYDDHGMIMQAGGRWYSYTGQLHLPESGLLYYKARMYHPGLGRFLQPDPIWPISGMNGYGYVGGDPVNFTDPLGLSVEMEGVVCDDFDVNTATKKEDGTVECSGWNYGSGVGGRAALFLGGSSSGGFHGGYGLGGGGSGQGYQNPTFCPSPRPGSFSRFFPSPRIVSGKLGGFADAINDLDLLARVNSIPQLGSQEGARVILGQAVGTLFPAPVGGGWIAWRNNFTGMNNFHNGRLTFRYEAREGVIRIDMARGTALPSGGFLAYAETCHYNPN